MTPSPLHAPVLDWYAGHARDLPWRRPSTPPWGVLVSEIMLQQTPVARVLPAYLDWLQRWPTPGALAVDPPGEAVRAWGRLGYPRRALRLHQTARAIVDVHAGEVPSSYDDLLALPGVGSYTAAAVASFAFGGRHAVLDTNVRRVLARAVAGRPLPATTVTAGERRIAEDLLPEAPEVAAAWGVAVMELGALVCTSRAPRCADCPIASTCVWRIAGKPEPDTRRPGQRYAGTDRQVRGRLLAVLREAEGAVPSAALEAVWDDDVQRNRALAGLVEDGLVEPVGTESFGLPGGPART
jgi:A/G-specific adenine glycosylase